jgi:hypothetical protein
MVAIFDPYNVAHFEILPCPFDKSGTHQDLAFSSVELGIGSMHTLIYISKKGKMRLFLFFTQSSIHSFMAVINKTIIKGTNVVYLDVGEVPGIC